MKSVFRRLSPLAWAASAGRPDVVKILLKAGAQVSGTVRDDYRGEGKTTVLHMAAYYSRGKRFDST